MSGAARTPNAERPRAQLPEKDVLTVRWLAILASVAVVGFGYVYRVVLPEAHDPWIYRFVVAGVCLLVAGMSFLPGRPGFIPAVYTLFGVITAWVVVLLGMNEFAPEYALGLVVIAAIISAVLRSTRALAVYGAATLAGVALVAARIPEPRVSPQLFGSYLVVILVLFYIVVRNRLRAEREIAASEERYALAAQGAHDGLWDWDLRRGVLYLSPRWKEIVGCEDGEIGSDPAGWFDRIHPDDRARVDADLFRRGQGAGALFESEHRVRHSDGGWRWVLVRGVWVTDSRGAIVRMAGSQTDISQRKHFEEQLLHDALHDSLTGLPNRALFLDRLERAIAHTHRHPERQFAVIFLDLDRFKVINDRVGHLAADQVLQAIAERLLRCLRAGDSVARLGGDEFALLLEDVDNPAVVAQRVQHELQAPFEVAGQQLGVTASLGIAISSTGFSRPVDVLRDADAAMYRAKARGRARVEIADAELHAHSLSQLELESQLREAVENGELRLHFQPIVVMETRELVGFEALLRWQHPGRGLIGPEEFIPLAEQTGMIMPVGRWALRDGCRQMREWRGAFPEAHRLWLSVNLSSRQFLHPQLVQEIHAVLAETGFPPDRLRLEITESVIMDDPATVTRVLQRLRESGIRVALDDFGTGYSSLAYLHRLPLDTLKIDRSFVHQMHTDPALQAVIQTVISLSDSLRLDTVAEGVETDEDARALHRMGCRLGQGFLFSRPLAPADAGHILAALPAVLAAPQPPR
ncbi:putative bifunctional diguanylate cyclase/phosphodiesterase [Longimicrobium sp.]|uniref:putative bifunctional diguanylate cyclase/phosphodiesterase n=1 Tax=Longimicrobium sp. TaxID=2029185 RepID=UPI002F94DBA6